MRSKHALVLYILIILLLIAGLLLLFLRQPFIDYFRVQTGIAAIEVPVRQSPPAQDLLDTAILSSDKLSSLKDNVKVFSLDDVCGDSVNAVKPCSVGNVNPFLNK